jgi:hypothetical protein
MKQPTTHHLVDFASRYAVTGFKTLNAASAIWRAESLVQDAEALADAKNVAEKSDIPFGNIRSTYEIIDYFVVGYVTCLEWHARSRLVDIMLYRPSCIQTTDVKKIADLALSQMIAKGVTVPHLLGAASNVSHISEYLEIFRRVFNELGITEIIEGQLRGTKTEIDLYVTDADNSLYGILDEIFEERNRLVHEIGLSRIGHQSLRYVWEPSRAVEFGKAVVAAMKLVETKITQHSPKDFPNRLDEEGFAEDELEKLKEAITAVIKELDEMFTGSEGIEKLWKEAMASGIETQTRELAFLEGADFLRPVRHLDMRRDVQIEYLKTRLSYLTLLRSEAMDSYVA